MLALDNRSRPRGVTTVCLRRDNQVLLQPWERWRACASRALIAVFLLIGAVESLADTKPVRIGVQAHRAESLKLRAPTADYLTNAVPGYRFTMVPLDNRTFGPAVERGEMDFVLTNPGLYIELEARSTCLRRPGDVVARYGGEEFTVILPGLDLENGKVLAERARVAVENLGIVHPASTVGRFVTTSVRVASMVPGRMEKPDILIAAADQALYRAKQKGRNRVELAG